MTKMSVSKSGEIYFKNRDFSSRHAINGQATGGKMVQAFPFFTKLTNPISLSFYGHHFVVNEIDSSK